MYLHITWPKNKNSLSYIFSSQHENTIRINNVRIPIRTFDFLNYRTWWLPMQIVLFLRLKNILCTLIISNVRVFSVMYRTFLWNNTPLKLISSFRFSSLRYYERYDYKKASNLYSRIHDMKHMKKELIFISSINVKSENVSQQIFSL